MSEIVLELIERENIEQCRELCNELMAFQKSKAAISKESFDWMNFDTRMKASCEGALRSHTVAAKDGGVPIGYVFSTINEEDESSRDYFPDWAPMKGVEGVKGFYPDWVKFPQKIGCLSNLYIRDGYRGLGLGAKMLGMAMDWLESFDDVELIFVYISNGNDAAMDFYLKHGFKFSHDVFGEFIKAAYKIK
ncbi:MAG: GNAT family N-acetyltransferase [Synergistaceae bacterium]|nr:GNAT family N-acetyltransferase [Synergistaceae bacterium]